MCHLSREEMAKMPVLKNKTQGNYVNVYKGIVMDCSLSLKDRGMLLTLLSLPDNWDFTVAGLRKILPDGKSAIYNSLDSLQNAGYLTKEQSRGEHGVFAENIIEVHETPHPPFPEKRVPDNRVPEKPVPGNRAQLNNNKLNTKELNNPSINQEDDEMDRIDIYTDIVKSNIEYAYLLHDNPYKKEILEEILNLIIETIAIPRKSIRIAGVEHPHELVKAKFLKLNMGHIQYVLACMDKNVTKVRNIKNYLLTSLYNAPNTISSYYQSEVNHDMYGGDQECP